MTRPPTVPPAIVPVLDELEVEFDVGTGVIDANINAGVVDVDVDADVDVNEVDADVEVRDTESVGVSSAIQENSLITAPAL